MSTVESSAATEFFSFNKASQSSSNHNKRSRKRLQGLLIDYNSQMERWSNYLFARNQSVKGGPYYGVGYINYR